MTTPENDTSEPPVEVSEMDKIKEELEECRDKYLRQIAESENMRKRLQKEKQEGAQYAVSNILSEFLSPIDHMENALKFTQSMSDEVKHWGLGFQMILTQFKDVLANNGVQPVEAMGKEFDPNVHEAIEMVEGSESPPGIVVEECVKGYKMGSKLIRPARVKVAK
jgi:molecular chaperone GrpE